MDVFRDAQAVAATDDKPDLGGQPAELLNHRLHPVAQQGLGHVHPQGAQGLPSRLAQQREPVGGQQQLPGLGQGLLPHRGEDHPPARPLKEGDPQLLLQLLDLHGDGGLSVAQVLRRPLVAALVHHGQQGAQIFQLHGDSSNH